MTLQYNISVGQADPRPRTPHRTLGSAVAVSVAVHLAAIAIAVLGFGRHAPAAEDPAAITVFIPATEPAEPAAPAAETPVGEMAESKPAEPEKEMPAPAPDFVLPPPEESLAMPDFKPPPPSSPPPPSPPPAKPPVQATPSPPKPAPAGPAVATAPTPSPVRPAPALQPTAPVTGTMSPSPAPAIAPGWNVQLAAWLAAHRRYPSQARQRGEQGEVLVHFTVDADGRIAAVAIEKGSGHADLDSSALAMFQGALLPPPGAAATRTVRIRFRLDD